MIHVISRRDLYEVQRHAQVDAENHTDSQCLGLPEMASSPWDFDKDYGAAYMWARFCLDYLFPDTARHIVLGWMRKDGSQVLLQKPEVYTELGFKYFNDYAARNEFRVVHAVHTRD